MQKSKKKTVFSRIASGITAVALGVSAMLSGIDSLPIEANAVTTRNPIVYPNFGMHYGLPDLPEGLAAFCLDVYRHVHDGDTYVRLSESNYRLTLVQRKALGRICYYGYPNGVPSSVNVRSYSNNTTVNNWYCATQSLIWDVLEGKIDPYEFTGTSFYRGWLNSTQAAIYDTILANCKNHKVKASWDNTSSEMWYNHTTGKYETTIIDDKKITGVANYKFDLGAALGDGFTVTVLRDGSNNITSNVKIEATPAAVKAAGLQDTAKTYTVDKKFPVPTTTVSHLEWQVSPNNPNGTYNRQTMGIYVEADPVPAKITLSAQKSGDFTFYKKFIDDSHNNHVDIVAGSATFQDLAQYFYFTIEDTLKVTSDGEPDANRFVNATKSGYEYTFNAINDSATEFEIDPNNEISFVVNNLPAGTYRVVEHIRDSAPADVKKYRSSGDVTFTIGDKSDKPEGQITNTNPFQPDIYDSKAVKNWATPDGEVIGNYADFASKYGKEYADKIYKALAYKAYVQINGTVYYFKGLTYNSILNRYEVRRDTDESSTTYGQMYADQFTTNAAEAQLFTFHEKPAMLAGQTSSMTDTILISGIVSNEGNTPDVIGLGKITAKKIYWQERYLNFDAIAWRDLGKSYESGRIGDSILFVNSVRQTSLRFLKRTTNTAIPVAGVTFEIAENLSTDGGFEKGETIAYLTTGEDGYTDSYKIYFPLNYVEDRYHQQYMYREVSAPAGIVLNPNWRILSLNNIESNISRNNGENEDSYNPQHKLTSFVSRNISNAAKTATLIISKKDEFDNNVGNISFNIINNNSWDAVYNGNNYANGETITTVTTDASGKATVSGLPVAIDGTASYIIQETGNNAPYIEMQSDSVVNFDASTTEATATYVVQNSVIRNTIQKAKLEIVKTDASTSNPIPNAGFTITYNSDFVVKGNVIAHKGDVAGTLTTDATGKASSWTVPEGGLDRDGTGFILYPTAEYKISETTVPDGYVKMADKVFTIPFNSNGASLEYISYTLNLTNNLTTVPVEVVKVDNNIEIPLSGAKFELRAAQDIAHKINGTVYRNGEKIAEATTNASGIATFPVQVPVGYKYTIVEVEAPAGYALNAEPQTIEIPTNQKVKITKTFGDDEQQAKINIVKTDEYSSVPVSGAEFTLYAAENITYANGTSRWANGAKIEAVVTDSNGKASFSPVPTGHKYTVKETKVPEGYRLTAVPQTFTADRANQTIQLTTVNLEGFTNAPQEGRISIVKKDRATSTAISEAVFGLYANEEVFVKQGSAVKKFTAGQLIQSVTTDEQGKASFNEVPVGKKYYVQEISVPENYFKSDEKYEFKLDADNTVEVVAKSLEIFNDWELRPIEIVKTSEHGTRLAGAIFGLYAAEDVKLADGTVLYAKDTEIQRVNTDENGTATTQAVPVGFQYYIKELTPPTNYTLNTQKQSFELAYDANATAVTGNTVTKTFSNDWQKAEIKVYKTDGETRKELSGAEFTLYAAEDITLDNGTVLYQNGTEIEKVTTGNDGRATFATRVPVGFQYTLRETKHPEGYAPREISDTFSIAYNADVEYVSVEKEYTNDWQQGEITVIKKDSNTGTPLAGAEFGLYAAEDVIRDGNLVYANGTEIEKVTTGNDGRAVFGRVPVGFTYKVKELKAPTNYVNRHEEREFRLEYSATVEFVAESTDWNNDWQNGSITVFKYFGEEKTPLAGAEFSLTAVEDVKLADGTVLYAAGTEIDKVTTDATGYATFKLVPVSYTYCVKETKAPAGFKRNKTENTFVLSYNAEVEYSSVEKQVENKEIVIEFSKKDLDNGEELTGAELEIVDSEGNVYDSWTSNGTPHVVRRIPSGNYTFKETTAPDGYTTATSIEFEIDEDGNVTGGEAVTTTEDDSLIVMYDDYTKVELSKSDITTGDEIEGATLIVYDEDDNVVDSWVSTNTPHIIKKLKVGKTYRLHEEIAPDGYLRAEDVSFVVDDTGNVQKVKMKDDYNKLEISKTDITTGEEIEGAHLKIVDSEGNTFAEWTTDGTPHRVNRIPRGTYTLVEETAPDGYVRAESVVFTVVDDNEIQRVEMKDDYTKVQLSKTDITTGQEIAGAQLTILDSNGNEVASWESAGYSKEIDRLPAGEYTLREETAPDGYCVAEDVKFTVTETGEIQKVTMKDAPTNVEISKKSVTGDDELAGATLQVLDGESVIEEWTSTTTPHVIKAKLKAGKTYRLHETVAPDGYLVSEDDVEFTVSEDGSTDKVVMRDQYQHGSIKLTKKTIGNKHVEGIEFQLTGTSTVGVEVNMTATTNADGVAEFTNVPIGHYTITENAETVFEGYIVAENQTVDVENGQQTEITFENAERTGELVVTKQTIGQINVEGIEFILEGDSDTGRHVRMTSVTDENGKASFADIPIGTYTLTENGETVPTGYLVADEREVTVIYGQTTNVTINNNEKSGMLKIQKRTEGMLNVAGIEFILSGTADNGRQIELRATTNEQGVALFDTVPVGTYIIKENGATVPTAYMVCDEQEVSVVYAQTTNIEIRNEERKGNIRIQKRTVGMINLGGIDFVLEGTSDSGREISITATTNENGVAEFEGIPVGTYTIREVDSTVNEFYLVADEEEVTVVPATTTTVEITNEERSGKIQITKRTEGQYNVSDILFTVSGTADNGREVEISARTDAQGIAIFENVPVGTYTIHEEGSSVPVGYLTATDTECEVVFSETTNVEVTNEEKCGSIRIQKRTQDMTNIANIRFILSGTADNGRPVSLSATTNAQGIAEFGNVPVGTYTITEDGATVPTAYMVADAQTVTVTYAQTSNVTFTNNKKPETPQTPKQPSTPETPNPKTGAGLATIAGLGLVAAIAAGRKRKEDEED